MISDWFLQPYGLSGIHYIEIYADRLTIDRTRTEINGILKMIDYDQDTSFLDMPCGFGRHSLELTNRGFTVTGVDIHPQLIEYAERSKKAYGIKKLNFTKADMRSWCQKDAFDVALSLYTGFGYFDTDLEDDFVLHNLYTSLKRNGSLVVEYLNSLNVSEEPATEIASTLSTGKKLFTKSYVDTNKKLYCVKHVIDNVPHFFTLRLYTPDELCSKLQQIGFHIVSKYGDYDLSDFTDTSSRVIIVANKT